MNKSQFQQNKGLAAALLSLAMSVKPAMYEDGKTPKGRYSNSRKPTKKGAQHRIGDHFTPRYVTVIKIDGGKKAHVTPAAYRRLHIAKNTTPPKIGSPKPRGRNVMSPDAKALLWNRISGGGGG